MFTFTPPYHARLAPSFDLNLLGFLVFQLCHECFSSLTTSSLQRSQLHHCLMSWHFFFLVLQHLYFYHSCKKGNDFKIFITIKSSLNDKFIKEYSDL